MKCAREYWGQVLSWAASLGEVRESGRVWGHSAGRCELSPAETSEVLPLDHQRAKRSLGWPTLDQSAIVDYRWELSAGMLAFLAFPTQVCI